MSTWRWSPERSDGIWRHGAKILRPFVVAAPWLTVLLLIEMMHVISGSFTTAKGVLFDLPDVGLQEGDTSRIVALVMLMAKDTLVFFDDARYILGDEASCAAFTDHLAERTAHMDSKTLLILADRRVSGGELMKLAALAKRGGAQRVLFAEKRVISQE